MVHIAIGSDHRGFVQKQLIIDFFLQTNEYAAIDVGSHSNERTDFPIYAISVVECIKRQEAKLGILLCGTGIGMAIVANRFQGIYAGVVWSEQLAQRAKEDDNVNVLVLPSDYITNDQVVPIVMNWLRSAFHGGRYAERITMIDNI